MNSLPPLRTVRDSATSASGVTQPTPPKPFPGLGPPLPARPFITIDAPSLPKPARDFLGELVAAQLLCLKAIPDFVQKISSRATQLTSRERTADALVGLGFLRAFVMSRYLNNQVHGLVFGQYRVLDRLGSGSLGVVFLGEHIRLGRKVAIKTIPVDDTLSTDIIARFEQEARILASLDNPHIIKVYDEGILPAGGPGFPEMRYIALEYAAGGDLENFVYAHGPQSMEQVCDWGCQIAAALRVCHAAGLVHRDLKPSNLLLTEHKRIKIVDFGLARDFASVRTPSKILLGSLEFLAPEQVIEPATVGPDADIYSLGATLFWLFTGQLPYPQTTKQSEALDNIRSKLPLRARTVRPDLPKDIDSLLAKMLARNPAERPALSEIQTVLQQQTTENSTNLVARLTQPETDLQSQQIRQLEDELTVTKNLLHQAQLCFSNTIAAMASACPGETVQHQQRVARAVRLLAPYLATKPNWPMMVDPRIVEDYARAIAAHDFGVVTLGLGAERLEAHTKEGDEILAKGTQEGGSGLPQLRLIRTVVRHHHEAWNGTGYPDQLQGEHIPAIARLAAVVIAYDDARRGADGQPRLSHPDALRLIQSQAGTQFDPVVVEALIEMEAELDQHFWDVLEPGMEPVLPKPGSPSAIRAKVPQNRWGNRDRKI